MNLLRIFIPSIFFLSFLLLNGSGIASEQECLPHADNLECKPQNLLPRSRLRAPMQIERADPLLSTPPAPGIPQSGQPIAPGPAIAAPLAPSAPAALNTCDAGGCWGMGGGRYDAGAGSTYLTPAGRPCQRNGAFMQCF